MTRQFGAAVLVAASLLGVAVGANVGISVGIDAAQQPERSTRDGVYTQAQAATGRVLFTDICIVCHPDPFWRPTWRGKQVGELYNTILKYMPDDDPGSLSPAEVAAVLAYILEGNGAPSGTRPLPIDREVLDSIRVEPPLQ